MAEDKELNVVLRVRNLLRAGFAGAGRDVRRFNRDVGGGMAGFGASMTEAWHQVQVGVAAAESAVKLLHLGTLIVKGEFEGIADIVHSLPAGIGTTMKAVSELADETSGYADRVREAEKLERARTRNVAAHQRAMEQARQLAAPTFRIGRELELLGTEGLERDLLAIRHKTEAALVGVGRGLARALQHEIGVADRAMVKAAADSAVAAIREREPALIAALRKKHAKAEGELIRAEIERRDESWTRLRAEARAKDLRALDRHLDAEIELIKESYRQRAQIAKSGAEREVLARLQALDIAAARKTTAGKLDRRGIEATLLAEKRHDILSLHMGARQDPALEVAKRTEREAKETNKKLTTVIQVLREIGGSQEYIMVG